ncbi:hypothetical protein P879_05165 [Paragonimus westermani]|uniref:Ankyrin repeat domain-containing protein n=1 Tax=Paragonimus westermani TaxID=34504 RepID=A0A8T0DA69_9TREM|nr:hypothetical protein P879_05165 [Paragonimus westermani]
MKRTEKRLKLNITMTEEIPITVPQLLDMLRVLSPMSKFEKLRDLLKTGLPPGFPLRLEMPVFPTTLARVEVKNVQIFSQKMANSDLQSPAPDDIICSSSQTSSSLDRQKWFAIPEGYTFSGEFRLSKVTKSS